MPKLVSATFRGIVSMCVEGFWTTDHGARSAEARGARLPFHHLMEAPIA